MHCGPHSGAGWVRTAWRTSSARGIHEPTPLRGWRNPVPIGKRREAEKQSESAQIDPEDFHVSPLAGHVVESDDGKHGPETANLPGTD